MFYGPNGSSAKIMNTHGIYLVIVTDEYGNTNTYNPKKPHTTNKETTTYHGPDGGTASIMKGPKGNKLIKVIDANGNTIIYSSTNTQTYNTNIDNPLPVQTSSCSSDFNCAYGGDEVMTYVGKPDDNSKAYPKPYPTMPAGSKDSYPVKPSLNDDGKYNKYLPKGIPKTMIPPGNEDLYILKTEIVPPICPACSPPIVINPPTKSPPLTPPTSSNNNPLYNRQMDTDALYSYKKVPNYGAGSSNPYLPVPVLSNFSSFGM